MKKTNTDHPADYVMVSFDGRYRLFPFWHLVSKVRPFTTWCGTPLQGGERLISTAKMMHWRVCRECRMEQNSYERLASYLYRDGEGEE
jgi:hypothetical protein